MREFKRVLKLGVQGSFLPVSHEELSWCSVTVPTLRVVTSRRVLVKKTTLSPMEVGLLLQTLCSLNSTK